MKEMLPDPLMVSMGQTISLREAAIIATIREMAARDGAYKELQLEIGKRYDERDMANKAAMTAALDALKDAANELKENSKEYRASANEWRGQSKDMIDNVPTKAEVGALVSAVDTRLTDAVKTISTALDVAVKNINAQLALLQRSDIIGEGRKEQRGEGRININQFVGVVVGVLMALLAFWLRNKP